MVTYVGFLRAVNVGKRQVKMATLCDVLTDAGFEGVETFIASGNVRVGTRMRSQAKVEQAIESALEAWLGFDVPTIARTCAQLRAAKEIGDVLQNPLAGGARHYVAVLKKPPTTTPTAELAGWDAPEERIEVHGREVHLWLASARPKITNARLEKIVGTVATMRDWKTIDRLVDRWC